MVDVQRQESDGQDDQERAGEPGRTAGRPPAEVADVRLGEPALPGDVVAPPPCLIGGAKCQGATGEVGVDALRFVAPVTLRDQLEERLGELLGPAEDLARGYHFYAHGKRFGCGALLLWDADGAGREHAGVCVEMKGETIGHLGQLATWELWAWAISQGAKCTRFDVRVDFGNTPGLIAALVAASDRGELRGLRHHEHRAPKCGSELVGHSFEAGRRGKLGCGKFLRVYDKGLQTKSLPTGWWERWEVEFSQEAAHLVAADWFERGDALLVEHDGDGERMLAEVGGWLAKRAFGVVDFRLGKRLDRSERAPWWSAFLDGLAVVPTVVKRQASRLAGFREHIRRTIVPQLRSMAEATRRSLGDVLELLVGDVRDVRPASMLRPSVVQFAATVGDLGVVDRQDRRAGGAGVDRWRSWLDSWHLPELPDLPWGTLPAVAVKTPRPIFE